MVMPLKLQGTLPSWVSVSCLLVGLCLTVVGCGSTVKKPTSDSTPPSLVWNVYNHDTNQQTDYPGSPTINAKRGEKYRVTLKANDPEGVNWIKINPALGGGEIAWQCTSPPGGEKLGQNNTADLGPMSQNLALDANGNVLTSIFLIYELDFTLDCQAGWNFVSGSAKLTGQASN